MGNKFSLDIDTFHEKFGFSRWGKEGVGIVGINLTHLRKKAQLILSAFLVHSNKELGVHLQMPYCTHSDLHGPSSSSSCEWKGFNKTSWV